MTRPMNSTTLEIALPCRVDLLQTRGWVLPARGSAGPNGPVFAVVHGIGLSHRPYGRLARELRRHGTVVGLDLPGFGGMRKPASAVSVEEFAVCVRETITELQLRPVIAIGHSMGAQIALELALAAPGQVDLVVVIGPVVNPRHRTLIQQMFALARDTIREPAATNLMVLRDYLTCGMSWYLLEAREMIRYRTDFRAVDLDVPILAIRGQDDVIAPADWCDWLADQGPLGSSVSVPGHRHVVSHSAPEITAQLIADFARASQATSVD